MQFGVMSSFDILMLYLLFEPEPVVFCDAAMFKKKSNERMKDGIKVSIDYLLFCH